MDGILPDSGTERVREETVDRFEVVPGRNDLLFGIDLAAGTDLGVSFLLVFHLVLFDLGMVHILDGQLQRGEILEIVDPALEEQVCLLTLYEIDAP